MLTVALNMVPKQNQPDVKTPSTTNMMLLTYKNQITEPDSTNPLTK
jgi:hypothetical protein